MDTSHENMAEKRKIEEAQEGDLRVVKMDEDDHVQSKTTPGPKRKKFKKNKKDVDKTPLMLFNEKFPSVAFSLESSSGPSHQPEFIMSVVVEGTILKLQILDKGQTRQSKNRFRRLVL